MIILYNETMEIQTINDVEEFNKLFKDENFWKEFANAYRNKPWGEYLYCPYCNKNSEYDAQIKYDFEETITNKLTHCPYCSTELKLYWSIERIKKYFLSKITDNENFLCLVAKDSSELCGIIFGYKINIDKVDTPELKRYFRMNCMDDTFYIDIILVLKNYRRVHNLNDLIKQILFLFKVRLTNPNKNKLLNKIIDKIYEFFGKPVITKLYIELLSNLYKINVKFIITRTHLKAKNVANNLLLANFKRTHITHEITRIGSFMPAELFRINSR
jgi:isocitrate dehydrogenase kinase/phosphatase